jgi:hypothetical protein
MTSSRVDEGVVMCGDVVESGGNCSGDKLAGRAERSWGRERRLYGPPDIVNLRKTVQNQKLARTRAKAHNLMKMELLE